MSVDYNSLLTDDQKRNIINQRIAQFASDAYQHSLNKATSEKVGDADGIASSEKAIATLETAIEIHQTELATLAPEAATPTL